MSSGSLYERVLAQIEEGAKPPEVKAPRASASVVLWRKRDGRLEVFWIKRSDSLQFMGGFHAFPGGALSRRDGKIQVEGRPQGVDGAPPAAALPEAVIEGIENLGAILPEGLVACALRELFEETGVLLSPQLLGDPVPSALGELLQAGRRKLEAKQVDFDTLLGELDLMLSAGGLVYAGRWLTPPLGPLRFDNRFFLLEWSEAEWQQPIVLPGEAECGEWIEPGEALESWRSGRVITAPPILHILQVLAEEGPHAGLGRLQVPEEANLGPFRRVEFRPGVILFPLKTPTLPPASFTNTYAVGTGEIALIDPGSPLKGEIERLRCALKALEARDGRRVVAIWLTHHHPDHVGGVDALRHALGVPVCAHRCTAERLARSGMSVDREMKGDERIVLGGDPSFPVRVLHTPGHARGHLSFLDETYRSLLIGDLVAGFGTIVIDPPEGNMEDYLTSLRRMRDLEPEALFPAHGPPTGNASAKLDAYLHHRLWRERRVLNAWRSGRRRPAEMLSEVYDDLPSLARPLAERQIVAHLDRLRAAGALDE